MKKKIEAENTFKPKINSQTKKICSERYTVEKSPDGKEKVKDVLFQALYMDADERTKRQKFMEEEDFRAKCPFRPDIGEINQILGSKQESEE